VLVNFNVTGDLANLLLSYLDANKLDVESAPVEGLSIAVDELARLRSKLVQYNANSRMPFTDWWDALAIISRIYQKPHIGLEVGTYIQASHCGVLGYLSLSCEYIAEALQRFERFQRLLYEGNEGGAIIEGDRVIFSWPFDYGYSTRESDETLISGLATYIQMLAGDVSVKPLAVGFVHEKPISQAPFKQHLGCEVVFSCKNTYISFPVSMLTLKVEKADPVLRALLDQQANTLLDVLPSGDLFEQQLYKHLLVAMQDGQATIDVVAKAMNMSARTLHRRLTDRRLEFKVLLQKTRYQLANQYLKESRLTLSEIALLLGYSEQSAFSRAFKQWTGEAPLRFQKRLMKN
jgi:AraC-like DNA-binding protein